MSTGRLHKRFIFRELTRSGGQPVLFCICIMLSIQSIIAVDGFSNAVQRTLMRDARALHAADVVVRSPYPISDAVIAEVGRLEAAGAVESTPVQEFYSMVRSPDTEASVLADIKVAGDKYPFYGHVGLKSGRPFQDVLKPGSVVIDPDLADRLSLAIGDPIQVGDRTLTVRDLVVSESDRPVDFLSFGPRVFVNHDDGPSLGLMRTGSRVRHKLLIKVTGGETAEALAERLDTIAEQGRERVDTFKTARSRIKRFFDNFFFFLTLIALFTLFLSGIAIRSTLHAFIRGKETTIAAIKALGAPHAAVMLNYLAVIAGMGLIGTVAGMGAGIAMQSLMPRFFSDLLPAGIPVFPSVTVLLEGTVLGLCITALFAIPPLERLQRIRPAAVFRKDPRSARPGRRQVTAGILTALFFGGLVLWKMWGLTGGLPFIGGLAGLIAVATVLSTIAFQGIKKMNVRGLAARQALRGLFRPGNATLAVTITLSVSLGMIFTIFLVEENLNAAFVRSYPPDAPNLYFIDIQPDQVDDFKQAIDGPVTLYPIIRSRLASVNGERIEPRKERRRRGDNLGRPFNLTYRNHLLDDERFISGNSLFRDDFEGLQVSVLDNVVEMKPMTVGDRLAFNIQGVPVEAVISSIRKRTRESISPYFYFVFPEDSVIRKAPHTLFAALRIPQEQKPEIQKKITARFPNISVIDVSETIATFSDIAHRLARVIRFFSIFSIGAGVLILVSAVLATRLDRLREAAYFRVMGATKRFVLTVFSVEHLIMGGVSALLALGISHAAAWWVCHRILDINYIPMGLHSLGLLAATLILVTVTGALASGTVIRQSPMKVLNGESG